MSKWINLTARPKEGYYSESTRSACEAINYLAASAGYASYTPEEKDTYAHQCWDFIQNEINRCDDFLRERIEITVEEVEIEDDE